MAPPWPAFLSSEARAWGLGPERPRRPYRTGSAPLLPMRTVAWGRRRAWLPPPPWAFTRARRHRAPSSALDGAARLQKAARSSGERPSSAPWPRSAAAGAPRRHRRLVACRCRRERGERGREKK